MNVFIKFSLLACIGILAISCKKEDTNQPTLPTRVSLVVVAENVLGARMDSVKVWVYREATDCDSENTSESIGKGFSYTNPDGRVQFNNLAPGSYSIYAEIVSSGITLTSGCHRTDNIEAGEELTYEITMGF
jgi:hypothetical protein